MKHKNIFKIFDSTLIHHEFHVFKIIYSPYSMINIYKNEFNAKLVTLMIHGVTI
jgi:hypothetical protein